MQFYNYHSPRDESDKSDTMVQNLQNAIKAFQKEVSKNSLIHADSNSVQGILNVFSDILEDGFERTTDGEPSHYWSTISSILESTPMKFVNSLENFESDSEKAVVWLLIELRNKNLSNILTEILQIPRIMKYYSNRSVIHAKAAEVKETCKVLNRMDYTVESKFLKIYEENKHDFEHQSFTSSVLDRESWTRSLIREKTGSELLFSDTPSLRGQLSLIRDQQIDNVLQDFTISLTSSQNNSLQRSTTNVNTVKQDLQRYKTLLGRPTLNGEEEDDSHTFVRDNYKKDLEEKSKKVSPLGNPLGFISKVLDPVNRLIGEAPKKVLRKSSSYGDLTSKIKEEHSSGEDAFTKGNTNPAMNKAKLPRKSSCEFQMAPAPQFDLRHDLNPFESKRMVQVYNSSEQEQKDDNYESALGAYTASELRNMKNSRLLYIQKYQRQQAQFEYRAAPATMITPDQQGYKCFECGCDLNKLLLKIWPMKSYCNYTGYYYCNGCMGKEKHLIPWYARDNFDFKLYHVCRKGREELKRFYDKPTLQLDHKERVVLENKILYDALVMKRQLHLMFDMICESPYVLDLLGANAHLLLKENLFSLKNLSEIYNGAMQKYMEKCFEMLKSHVSGCSICQNKGKICPSCSDKKKLFAFDIKNTSVCRTCKYIYHTRCLKLKKCIVCQHNS